MKISAIIWTIVMGSGLLAAGILLDGGFNSGIMVGEAQARIGRPATPGSVAGVARRTTRRRIRRTTVYVATLPRSCSTVIIEGATLYLCGGTYYQPYGGQYVVVKVN